MAIIVKTPVVEDLLDALKNKATLSALGTNEQLERLKGLLASAYPKNEASETLNKVTLSALGTNEQLKRLKELTVSARIKNEAFATSNKAAYSAMSDDISNARKMASKTLSSFNLYPSNTFESILKSINYPASIEQALARDWQNVGNDLWKSYLTVSDDQSSDDHE